MPDPGCGYEDERGQRCGKTPTVVRLEVIEMVEPRSGVVKAGRSVKTRDEVFYCLEHLSEAYLDDGDNEGD